MTDFLISKSEQELSKVVVLEQELDELDELKGKVDINNNTIDLLTKMLNEAQKENKMLRDLLYKVHEVFSGCSDNETDNDTDDEMINSAISKPILIKESDDPHEIIYSECVDC